MDVKAVCYDWCTIKIESMVDLFKVLISIRYLLIYHLNKIYFILLGDKYNIFEHMGYNS